MQKMIMSLLVITCLSGCKYNFDDNKFSNNPYGLDPRINWATSCEGLLTDPVHLIGNQITWHFSIDRDENYDPRGKPIQVVLKDKTGILFIANLSATALQVHQEANYGTFLYENADPNAENTPDIITYIRYERKAESSRLDITAYGKDLSGGDNEKTISFQMGYENFSNSSKEWIQTGTGWRLPFIGDVDRSFCGQ